MNFSDELGRFRKTSDRHKPSSMLKLTSKIENKRLLIENLNKVQVQFCVVKERLYYV